jgi:hypothetical protein
MRGISEFIGIKYAFQNLHNVKKFCILYDYKFWNCRAFFRFQKSTLRNPDWVAEATSIGKETI